MEFNFNLTNNELTENHEMLENFLLAKNYTRNKLFNTASNNDLSLLTKMLIMIVFKKQKYPNENIIKKLVYKQKYIKNRIGNGKKINLLLKSPQKVRNFWKNIKPLIPAVISCYLDKHDNSKECIEKEEKKEENEQIIKTYEKKETGNSNENISTPNETNEEKEIKNDVIEKQTKNSSENNENDIVNKTEKTLNSKTVQKD